MNKDTLKPLAYPLEPIVRDSDYDRAIGRKKETAEQSAALKTALKHERATEALAAEAAAFPLEADEAFFEVQDGRDTCEPDSWVAIQMRANA